MSTGHPNEPDWFSPPLPPQPVKTTETEPTPNGTAEVEVITYPAEIVHHLVGAPEYGPAVAANGGERLYAKGTGHRQIRWNFAGRFAADNAVTADALADHVRRFDADELVELFEAGPWDTASDLSEGEWERVAAGFSKLLGRPVAVEDVAPWVANKPTAEPPRDGEAKPLISTTPPPAGSPAAEVRQMARENFTRKVRDLRTDLTLMQVGEGIEQVKREAEAKRRPLRDLLRRER